MRKFKCWLLAFLTVLFGSFHFTSCTQEASVYGTYKVLSITANGQTQTAPEDWEEFLEIWEGGACWKSGDSSNSEYSSQAYWAWAKNGDSFSLIAAVPKSDGTLIYANGTLKNNTLTVVFPEGVFTMVEVTYVFEKIDSEPEIPQSSSTENENDTADITISPKDLYGSYKLISLLYSDGKEVLYENEDYTKMDIWDGGACYTSNENNFIRKMGIVWIIEENSLYFIFHDGITNFGRKPAFMKASLDGNILTFTTGIETYTLEKKNSVPEIPQNSSSESIPNEQNT